MNQEQATDLRCRPDTPHLRPAHEQCQYVFAWGLYRAPEILEQLMLSQSVHHRNQYLKQNRDPQVLRELTE